MTAPALDKYDVEIKRPVGPMYLASLNRWVNGQPGYVRVEGLAEDMQTRELHSCGFCEFDENDIAWAEPAGLLKVVRRLIRLRDRRKLTDFVPDAPPLDLYCVDVRYRESRDAYPRVFAEFIFL